MSPEKIALKQKPPPAWTEAVLQVDALSFLDAGVDTQKGSTCSARSTSTRASSEITVTEKSTVVIEQDKVIADCKYLSNLPIFL